MKLDQLVHFNPKTRLPTGEILPFVDMAALPTSARNIAEIGSRLFRSSGAKFANGDTLLARITPCLENGKGAKVSSLPGGSGHGSTEFIVMRARQKNDEDFVYYLSRHPDFRSFAIQRMSGTSGRQRVAWQSLADFEVHDLSPADREKVGSILSALDDKIELNRRMNETLEAQARALFRDWFVDFGPVKAKMAGAAPYLAPDLWSLFPNLFDDDGVPQGWRITPLDEVAHFLNGLALQKFPPLAGESSLPVVKIADLRTGPTEKSNRASTRLPEKYVIDDGDFIFSWSGSLLAKFWTHGKGALNQHLFKVTSDQFPKWFFSQWVWHHMAEFQMIAASKATTMGHIQRGHLSAAMCLVPPPRLLAAMTEIVAPLLERTIANELENRTLAQTRDLLLPKLMSGDIRVGAIAREMELTP